MKRQSDGCFGLKIGTNDVNIFFGVPMGMENT
jgi:hypothetical protein